MSQKTRKPYRGPTAADLAAWMLRTASFETTDRMAEEVAVQMPSPGEFELFDIPERAKVLRRTLLRDIDDASDLEEAKVALVNMAVALGLALTDAEIVFVDRRAVELGVTQDCDPDFSARQIVDDAYRAGLDIQFKQHLVEARLRERRF